MLIIFNEYLLFLRALDLLNKFVYILPFLDNERINYGFTREYLK